MIDYDPHRWWRQLHYVRGSMVREIVARVLICVAWAIGVTLFHRHVSPVDIPLTLHTLAGVALSLLLVFRTNSSYDRFWEGRKLWGGIVNETRNLARAAKVFLREDPALYRALVSWIVCFPFASAAVLRGAPADLGPTRSALPPAEVERASRAKHPALAVAQQLSDLLAEGQRRGHYSDYVQIQLDHNVQLLVDYLGSCERIHKTPMPFAYMMHLRRALLFYVFTLPFALVADFGWGSVVGTFAVAYVFFGIEEIGVEIEDPFGTDDNDLPLERICTTIQGDLLALIGSDPGDSTELSRRAE